MTAAPSNNEEIKQVSIQQDPLDIEAGGNGDVTFSSSLPLAEAATASSSTPTQDPVTDIATAATGMTTNSTNVDDTHNQINANADAAVPVDHRIPHLHTLNKQGSFSGLNKSMVKLNEEAADATMDHVPDYRDYLHAQRALMFSRRDMIGGSRRFSPPGQSYDQTHHRSHRKHYSENDIPVIPEHQNYEEHPRGNHEISSTTSEIKHRRQLSNAMSIVGNRIPNIQDSAAWDSFFANQQEQLETEEATMPHHDLDDHGHDHDSMIPIYCPPVQRQRWGDDQILPHINWGDLFFDLFYVAAAYNLGVLLISSMNAEDWPRGVVYFIGIFGPLYNTWENDLHYSSRYTVVDHAHRFFDAIRFVLVASVVLHIKTLDFMTDTTSIETFWLMLSLCLESFLQLFLNLEVAFFAEGDRNAIYDHTMRKVRNQYFPNALVYMAAAIIAGFLHFGDDYTSGNSSDYSYGKGDSAYDGDSSSSYGDKGYGDDVHGNSTHGNSTSGYGEDNTNGSHRFLAEATGDATVASKLGSGWVLADLPYFLCLAMYVLGVLGTAIRKTRMANDHTTDIRDRFVPNNVDYLVHRYGEWTMLMIGESILSLLIVETVETEDYYIIALVGVLTVILIQTLKFESEPSHARGHALWRSMTASISYSILIQTLSMGLIAFGVSFKVMLTLASSEYNSYSTGSGGCDNAYYGDDSHRMLAAATVNCGGDTSGYDEDSKKRFLAAMPSITETAAASLYCWSLTIVLISLELMVTTHHDGFRSSWQFLYREQLMDENGDFAGEGKWKLKVPMLLIATVKLGLIGFIALLSQWHSDPRSIACAGFLAVSAIAFTRIVGWSIVNREDKISRLFKLKEKKTPAVSKHLAGRPTTTLYGSRSSKPSLQKRVPEPDGATDDSDDDSAMSNLDKIILDSSFDAIIITDKTGIIKHVNATTLTAFGYGDSRELLGINVSRLVGEDEAWGHSSYVEALNKIQRTATKIGKQRVLHSRRKDGTEFPCIIGIKPVPGSTDLIGYIRNTDELEKDQPTTLPLLEDPILRLVDDSSFDSIIVMDKNGIMVHVNATTVSDFGYASKQDLIGNNVSILVGGGLADKHETFVESFCGKNKADTVIGKQRFVKSRRKDGSEFSCIIGINNVPGSECLIGYIRNIEGISKLQQVGEKANNLDFSEDSFDSKKHVTIE